MKASRQTVRIGIIAVASFVLFFTVLPQVASAFGLHALSDRLASTVSCGSGTGSSSSVGSSSSTCGPGTITGTVKVTKAPAGFTPEYLGAGACPDTGITGQSCASPQYALASSNGTYSLTLNPGKYMIAGFYENNAYGGAFLGTGHAVTVTTGETHTLNLTVPYKKPAAITGTITVTGVPTSDPIDEFEALLCPSFATYTGNGIPLACVTTYSVPSSSGVDTGTYSVSGLPPGDWTAYAGFCTVSACEPPDANDGTAVTLVAGQTTTVNLTTRFLQPGQAFVSGIVSVTGAPAGFSDQLGVSACPQSGACQVVYYVPNGQYGLILPAGTWTLKGFYLASPFNNAIDGPSLTVALASGQYAKHPLPIPYQVLGTATGSITISGLPAGVSITDYTVLACPSSEPWTGGIAAPECVSEYSGPAGYEYGPADSKQVKTTHPAEKPPAMVAGPAQAAAQVNRYSLPTLTAGSWLLYPGYEDAFGSVTEPTATKVTITSAKTTTKNLTVAYVTPSQGAVIGTVDVIGAPSGGTSAGAQACTALPSGTTCQGEVDAYTESNGSYTLLLEPGTWWVRGFVDVVSSSGLTQANSSPVEIHLSAGHEAKENFAVAY
jgi:hypothetical protein